MKLADKLVALMKSRGLSQDALAAQLKARGLDVSQRAVSGWLSGSEPRASALRALADLFEIDVLVLGDAARELPPFEEFSQTLRADRDIAVEAFPKNTAAQGLAMDHLAWQRVRRREAARIRRTIGELANIAYDLDSSIPEMAEIGKRFGAAAHGDEAEILERSKLMPGGLPSGRRRRRKERAAGDR